MEWIVSRKDQFAGGSIINWQFKGEIPLDLMLEGGRGIPTKFELARFIKHSSLVRLIKIPEDTTSALEQIRRKGYYIDIIWSGYSPESLEEYFKERLLPLPPCYKEEFDRIDQSPHPWGGSTLTPADI